MRRKRDQMEEAQAVKVDMSSMVDLSFLLLVYFLVTTSLLAKEMDLPMALPSMAGESAAELSPVSIRVEEDNRVVLHPGQSFEEVVASAEDGRELSGLRDRLSMLQSVKQGVQLDVKDGASYQRFMDVMNCLRDGGWESVGITHL